LKGIVASSNHCCDTEEEHEAKDTTVEDVNLRTALENMRYAACTPEDIKFLKTWIAGRHSDQPKLSGKDFRNVSIITALNSQKDRINELGSV